MYLNALHRVRQTLSPYQPSGAEPPADEMAVPREQVDLHEAPAVRPRWASILRGSALAGLAFAGVAAFTGPAHAMTMDPQFVAITDSIKQHAQSPPQLHATVPPRIKGDYIAHGINFSNLISNREFENENAVSQQDIQRYLESQHSSLGSLVVDGRHAARIVAEAAHQYHVNPVVILATLEKESGLVTYSSGHAPPNWLQRSAMGYGYDDAGSTAGRRATFQSQVQGGTQLLRSLYDEGVAQKLPTHVTVNYGTRKIQVDNAATYALYRYTPHTTDIHLDETGGGNYLFRHHYIHMTAQLKQLVSVPPRLPA